jgi:hypothetical protein
MHKGYILFTTHDRDELDATFIPDGPGTEALIKQLYDIKSDRDMEKALEAFFDWKEKTKTTSWATQTRCFKQWPFNNVQVLGTFYCLVY